ncbi:hypothetical protein AMS68_002713 [Peltaster fructicola]|uniref:Uncharacterized protein n=1 Tax=Peltaster fructicola TaxID=286661 RepID=A0A6H0XR79_9PEZI|nr:hypothetical protein AMS68_002713 [Peltaster fructicola]
MELLVRIEQWVVRFEWDNIEAYDALDWVKKRFAEGCNTLDRLEKLKDRADIDRDDSPDPQADQRAAAAAAEGDVKAVQPAADTTGDILEQQPAADNVGSQQHEMTANDEDLREQRIQQSVERVQAEPLFRYAAVQACGLADERRSHDMTRIPAARLRLEHLAALTLRSIDELNVADQSQVGQDWPARRHNIGSMRQASGLATAFRQLTLQQQRNSGRAVLPLGRTEEPGPSAQHTANQTASEGSQSSTCQAVDKSSVPTAPQRRE